MNLLFVVKGLGYGGAAKQLALTANHLSKQGYHVFVHTFCGKECYQKLDSEVTYIPSLSKIRNRQIQWFTYPFTIRRIVKKYEIDLIIAWRTNAGSYANLATIGTKTKTIFCERSNPYMEPSNIHVITTFLASLSDGGVFQTPQARDYYQRLAPKSVIIPNPIDPAIPILPIVEFSTRPKEIVFVGRMSIQQKRLDILLKVMEKIHAQLPDYKLRMYGDGKDLETVTRMAKEMGLEHVVVFEGVVNNVVERIRNARLMLLTSDYEGIPNVVLEAFQAGVPVISTDCSPGGCHVLIEDGINGHITPFRDDMETACRAIDLLSDKEKCMRYIMNSRRKLNDFAPDKICQLWCNYINSLMKEKDS